MSRLVRTAAAVLALAVVGPACALPKDKVPPGPSVVAAARTGGSISVGITRPAGVDPLSFHDPAAGVVAEVLCDTLVVADPATRELRPGLVKKWTVTDDGARVMFQLRQDAYFHDGRQVRSADIVDAWKRVASPESVSYVSDLLAGVAGYEDFRKAVEEGEPTPEFFGLRVIEPFSFEVFLTEKDPDFLRVLTHPALAPVSKSPYDTDDATAPAWPRCTGPYALVAPFQREANEIVLQRFDRYYKQNAVFAGHGGGFADEIRMKIYPDVDAVYQAFARGEVDVAGVPSPRLGEARQRFGDKVVLGDLPQAEFVSLPLGEGSPFRIPAVRKALSLALDRAAIADQVFGGARQPATGFVPPALSTVLRAQRGKTREVTFGCSELSPAAQPERAREAWAEAAEELESTPASPTTPLGSSPRMAPPRAAAPPTAPASPTTPEAPGVDGSGGPPAGGAPPESPPITSRLKLYFNDEANHRRLVETIASQWTSVLGVEVELVGLGWDEFLQKATTGQGFDGPHRLSYGPLYAGVQPFLKPLFHSEHAGNTNLARYTNHAFEIAYRDDVRPVVDEHERSVRYQQWEKLLCDDLPILPVVFGRSAYVTSARVMPARDDGQLVTRDGKVLLRELVAVG